MAEDTDSDDALFMGVNLPPPADEVQLIMPPTAPSSSSADAQFFGTEVYQPALDIFSGKKFGCPSLPIMRSLLDPFLALQATGFFKAASVLAKRFDKLKKDTKSVFKSVRAKTDLWVKPYIAPRLSLLLSLRELRLKERASEAAAMSTSTETPLQRAFTQLYDAFSPFYTSYLANEENEKNKKHRTPSLQLHTNDARPHEHFQWNASMRIKCPCPVCLHVSTVQFHPTGGGGSDADPMGAERIAAANAMSSANTGCFCFRINCHGKQDGSGCYLCEEKAKMKEQPPVSTKPGVCVWGCPVCACHCSCTFSEKNRMTIGMGWRKQKEKESKMAQKEPAVVEKDMETTTLVGKLEDIVRGGASRRRDSCMSLSSGSDELDGDMDNDIDDSEDDDDCYNRKWKRSKKKRKADAAYARASLDLLHSDSFSDPNMRKLLRKGMPCNTDATSGMEKMMAKAGVKSSSSPSAPTNIHQAREITRGINSKHKAAASNKSSNALKSDRTPSNATFLSNKNKRSNNRQYRNDLSKFTPEKKKEVSLQERTRKRATKKSFSPTTTPCTVEIMDIIQERVCDPEDVLFTVVEDMNPVCSQDALGFCVKRAQRELSSKKQG